MMRTMSDRTPSLPMPGWRLRPRPAGARAAIVALALLGVVAAMASCQPVAPSAGAETTSTGTVSGTAWWDLDGDGLREAGEPGVARLVIARLGTATRVETGASGAWSLALPPGTWTLTALTGWLPSACPGDLTCAAGRTRDQRWAVQNQFVRARVTVTSGGSVAGLDLGLLPDHGDPTGRSTSQTSGNDPGDGSALVHDLAVRNSVQDWYAGCSDPNGTRGCPVGTTLRALGQVFNQGTAWVTGIRFVLTLPPGVQLAGDPVLDRATPGTAPARTGRTGSTVDGGRWIEFTLGRNLAPATAVLFTATYRITSGPTSPTPLTRDYDHKAYLSIDAVDPADDDAPLLVDPNLGLDGGHNVNWPKALDDDTSDAIEFNVVA